MSLISEIQFKKYIDEFHLNNKFMSLISESQFKKYLEEFDLNKKLCL